ncbi:WSC domain-containing protein [Pterulicium gracile]|uniref:WSC domain-containing protein n=1 Tax=Pterulicium gracile TaxID=1884261 RepID=A0A5C3QCB7_9AGAR|nr:WSC domain-containing protein [Pterula gracilis]
MFFRVFVASLLLIAPIASAAPREVISTSNDIQGDTASIMGRQGFSWNDLGCFADTNPIRALNGGLMLNSPTVTITACLQECNRRGYSYAGLEYGQECYCDWKIRGNPASVAKSQCNMPCAGDGSTTCGGSNRIQIYVQSPAFPAPTVWNPSKLVGCFTNPVRRTLRNFQYIPGQMTASKCYAACGEIHAFHAGLEYGNECYCDNYPGPDSVLTPLSECDMACAGGTENLCGGSNRMLVYNRQL